MKKKIKALCAILCCAVLFFAVNSFACNLSGKNTWIDAHWHHNWTIFAWINYWQSSVMSAHSDFTSDTSGHVIAPYMRITYEDQYLFDYQQRSDWGYTVNNTLLTGSVKSYSFGICSHLDCSIPTQCVEDASWDFDNEDPRK